MSGCLSPVFTESPIYCGKCLRQDSVILLSRISPMCGRCFDEYFTHKFRSVFGRNQLIKVKEKVAIAWSGNMSSCALLKLCIDSILCEGKRRLQIDPVLIFIDDSSLNPEVDLEEIFAFIAAYQNVSSYLVNIGQIADSSCQSVRCYSLTEYRDRSAAARRNENIEMDSETDLKAFMASLKSLTAKEAALKNIKRRLLYEVAKQLHCSKVLLSSDAMRMASRLLSLTAQGKGVHLAYDMALVDTRFGDVEFLRPLKNFDPKAIAFFCHRHGLIPPYNSDLSTKAALSDKRSSLDRVSENFLTSLQADFVSSVSTVNRTGEKFAKLPPLEELSRPKCAFCSCPANNDEGWSLDATAAAAGSSQASSFTTDRDSLHRANHYYLCYSCSLISDTPNGGHYISTVPPSPPPLPARFLTPFSSPPPS